MTLQTKHDAFNHDRANAFLERASGLVNDGAVAVMMGIGHRTGLFDTLAAMPPATSPEIDAQ